jgi:uncharacterized protein YjdB
LATGVALGTTQITASLNGVVSPADTLTVTPAVLVSVTIQGAQSLPIGLSSQYKATANYSDGSTQDVTTTATWTSTDPGFLTVGTNTGLVTAVSVGSSMIKATLSGMNDSSLVNAVAATLQSLIVEPNPAGITAGTTYQLYAIATYSSSGSTLVVPITSNGASWISSNPALASVDPNTGLLTAIAAGGPVTITASLSGMNAPASVTILPANPKWTLTGNLYHTRHGQTATLLNNGLVLIAGGRDVAKNDLAIAELYNPATGTFTQTGSMNSARYEHTATLLNNGTVLITGGEPLGLSISVQKTAEIYDPATGSFTLLTQTMTVGRENHSATLLNNGMVLIAGGVTDSGPTASAELYDPGTGLFTATGTMNAIRIEGGVVLLGNGKVLFTGGINSESATTALSSAELYDPSAGTFTATGSMEYPRADQTATLLANGKVLIAGGLSTSPSGTSFGPGFSTPANEEIYDPTAGTFSPTGALINPRAIHTATLLGNGTVLIAGGGSPTGAILATSELYDPNLGTFAFTANLNIQRLFFTSTLLPNGTVLAVGGLGINQDVAAAEFYSLASATAPTATAVTSNNNPSVLGQSVMFTATVTPQEDPVPAPSGSVTFKDGATTLGSGSLSSGSATFTTSSLAAGTHSITAVYGGDSNYSGSTSSVLTQVVNNPVPVIIPPLVPAGAVAGSAGFTLTVNGSSFVNGATATFGGTSRAVTFVNSGQVTIAVQASDVASVGTPAVIVTNPTPGGGASNSVAFNVTAAANPLPAITTLSPTSVSAGSGQFTLTVSGSNFINGSVVQWNASPRATTFVNSGQLTATITTADVLTANIDLITVFNPAPGGGTSNVVDFSVTTPIPALSSLVPNSAIAGGPQFTLTVNGGNFINTSEVKWNGSVRSTTFVNAGQLTATITAADILNVGTASVAVFTPTVVFSALHPPASAASPLGAPSGITSNPLMFTISAPNPLPTLTSLAPNTTAAGGAAFTLTINGTNFVANTVAQWNGSPRATTFVNATQVTAAITAADVASMGTAPVTVVNPTPGGGTSNALTFTITDFSVSNTSGTKTVAAGQAAMYTINAAGLGGNFPGTVTFSATGLPAATTASFNPTSVTPGAGTVPTTLTLTTTARATTAHLVPAAPREGPNNRPMLPQLLPQLLLWLGVMSLLGLTLLLLQRIGKLKPRIATTAFLALTAICVAGFASGCNGGYPPDITVPAGTPAGTYTITVTGTSGSVSHSTTVSLTVQ